ncbi:MAG: hypothetical protein ACRDSL_02475 [Pseudonocardiaceae bacterium]
MVELVDARTGSAHLVRDDAFIVGRPAGRYLAVCDTVVLAASLTAPTVTYCRSCANTQEWWVLHRAHEGGVTKRNGAYFTAGLLLADYLAVAFDGLISSGLLALGQPDPIGERQVCVTHTGQARYSALRSAQRGSESERGG